SAELVHERVGQLVAQHAHELRLLASQVLERQAQGSVVQAAGPVTDAGRLVEALLAVQDDADAAATLASFRPAFAAASFDRIEAEQLAVLLVRGLERRRDLGRAPRDVIARAVVRG